MIKIKLVEIFYLVDEFCKESEQYLERKSLPTDGKARRNRKPRMSDSEVMTILICFHLSGARELKGFYLGYIRNHCIQEFPKQLSYNRFVERKRSVGVLLMLLLNLRCLGTCTGISFIDSTPITYIGSLQCVTPYISLAWINIARLLLALKYRIFRIFWCICDTSLRICDTLGVCQTLNQQSNGQTTYSKGRVRPKKRGFRNKARPHLLRGMPQSCA